MRRRAKWHGIEKSDLCSISRGLPCHPVMTVHREQFTVFAPSSGPKSTSRIASVITTPHLISLFVVCFRHITRNCICVTFIMLKAIKAFRRLPEIRVNHQRNNRLSRLFVLSLWLLTSSLELPFTIFVFFCFFFFFILLLRFFLLLPSKSSTSSWLFFGLANLCDQVGALACGLLLEFYPNHKLWFVDPFKSLIMFDSRQNCDETLINQKSM